MSVTDSGAQGGASGEREEEMQEHMEIEDVSTSNVRMLATGGNFITGTADGTVD